MKNSKLAILIVFIVFFNMYFSLIFACPHYDENGNLYYLYYGENNEINIEYIKENYSRLICFDEKENVLYERFNIFLSEDDLESEIDFFKNGNRNIQLISDFYEIQANLTNTYDSRKEYIDNYTQGVFYAIRVKEFTKNIYKEEYSKTMDLLNKLDIKNVKSDILFIEPMIMVQENEKRNWKMKTEVLPEFKDSVRVNILLKSENSKIQNYNNLTVVKVKFDGNISTISEMSGEYNAETESISFDTNEIGTYMIVEKVDSNQTINYMDENKKYNIKNIIIIIVITITIIVVKIVVDKKNKRK